MCVASLAPGSESSGNEAGGENTLDALMSRPAVEHHVIGLPLRGQLPSEDAADLGDLYRVTLYGSDGNDVARIWVAIANIATAMYLCTPATVVQHFRKCALLLASSKCSRIDGMAYIVP